MELNLFIRVTMRLHGSKCGARKEGSTAGTPMEQGFACSTVELISFRLTGKQQFFSGVRRVFSSCILCLLTHFLQQDPPSPSLCL